MQSAPITHGVPDTAVIITVGTCNFFTLMGFLSASVLLTPGKLLQQTANLDVEHGSIQQPSDSPIVPNTP
jgi:hypothetical protein